MNKDTIYYSLAKLNKIANGNAQFIDKMIQLFIDTTPADIENIRNHFKMGKYEEVSQIAHKLIPSIDYICTKPLDEEIRKIEAIEKDSVLISESEIEATLSKIELAISQLKSR